MAELTAAAATTTQGQVYGGAAKSVQVWRSVLSWLAFFFQVFVQIVRGTPSLSQLFSFLGLRHSPFFCSPSSPSSSSSIPFKPLPLHPSLPDSDDDADHTHHAVEKLTMWKMENFSGGETLLSNLPLSDGITKVKKVVLDLDETLVCAYETSSLPTVVRNQAAEAGLKWFELECTSGDKEGEGKQKVNHVTVFERPGLQEFLQQISNFADLVLFTAGLEGYARPLVDKIDLENRFSLRLYRPATISTIFSTAASWPSVEG